MPRVSNADRRLIQAAQDMLKHSGLNGMNLRKVAAKAGVNLGMFHYHFKSKDKFTRAVLQDTYEKFFQEFSLETTGAGPALSKLRSALFTLGRFIGENRRMLLGILQDLMNKDKVVLDFVKVNAPRHGLVIVGLVKQCQKEGSLRKISMPALMPMLMGACLFPLIMVAMLEHLDVKRFGFIPFGLIKTAMASDRALRDRVDLVLESLAPRKGKKP
jgi:AcrR family transcriptional regulator